MRDITLVFVKPDAFEYKKEIKERYLKKGLQVLAEKELRMDRELAEEFYKEHAGKPYFEANIRHITSGKIFAMIICGEKAIKRVRELNGATNPDKAEIGTIRWEYGTHCIGSINPKNAVHASDSNESAEREIDLIFGKGAYRKHKKEVMD